MVVMVVLVLSIFYSSSVLSQSSPLALHQLVSVEAGSDVVIRLKSYDTSGDELQYEIRTLPETGYLYQLSQVYSDYGYQPVAGSLITEVGTIVTGSNNRVYYRRPEIDVEGELMWSNFSFAVVKDQQESYEATVSLVAPSGILTSSDFLLNGDDWTITGNKVGGVSATHESFSRGSLSNYIYASDDKINAPSSGAPDSSLWYFEAPKKYTGNLGISYGGVLQFTLGAFSGDFSKTNGEGTSLVVLECAECPGPKRKGVKLVFPISASSTAKAFTGSTTDFTVSLTEGAGWLKDPQNSLTQWEAPIKCDFIKVLSRLSAIRILGDWTTWHESVALDNVRISNNKGQLPYCSQLRPDASICECPSAINRKTGFPSVA